ncbi:hypothetical protein GOP47_0007261 [Adiantum capillus-veneris]|uniref:TPD1 protein homolog 1-like n=1 Tax=Adiantum capillus-veneris TaxID=13818 RepID=A0A9D4ZKR3_ADICA|nr:hypothetical protein GOP47_0007261 [Adiantum capillus-veneris]
MLPFGCFTQRLALLQTVIYLLSIILLISTSSQQYVHACTSRDISISQSRDDTPGIPQFIVQIINTCTSGCTPSDIHLNCGWFASAGTINPKVFRRVAYNDCVVNGGGPLPREAIVRFTYRNSFMYPLSFKSAKFC